MVYPFPGIDWTDFIADDHEARPKRLSSLRGDQVFLIAHHAYCYTVGQILATFKSPNRTVTANFAIGPTTRGVDDYKCVHTVETDRDRAYTTASSRDAVAVTFEMANLSLDPPYRVGMSGKRIAAHLAAWMHVEYGMPLDRWHITCHREVYERGWGSYATSCPGDDLHDALDWIVVEAKRIVASGLAGYGYTPIKEVDVAKHRQFQNSTDITIRQGVQDFPIVAAGDTNFAQLGPGLYDILLHLYIRGLVPGMKVDGRLVLEHGTTKVRSGWYAFTIEGSVDGNVRAVIPNRIDVPTGYNLRLSLSSTVPVPAEGEAPLPEPILDVLGTDEAVLVVA